ncbi:MAG: selenocysteine-specific translation elongation factor [Verrucomicrobia bacterium]|nr:selenocysteine-specific translation elongation factor [Verrucomicrobiota bacterium]
MKHFVLATAGHVDHGKSALVKALTGTDPDRLPEEKMRGITIDLGFAELNLTGPAGEKLHVGIVDVPGHEDFIRNMIAGVGSIDLALLVIATDDGWMPQTEEHLQVLIYLGVERLVVALTKSDLGNMDIVTDQIRERLKETPFASCQIVPTSVRTCEGIETLKDVLASELAKLPPPRDIGKPRLFVDRAFTLRGIGTVVTGSLTGGSLQRGEAVVIQPRKTSARVRSLQSHNRDLDEAKPGMRTALNLPDVPADSEGIERGDVVTTQWFEPSFTLDVVLISSPRLPRTLSIKSGTSVNVHHGTTRVLAKAIFAETDSLAPGQTAVTQLKLDAPMLVFVGDRLILRDGSGRQTIAGGVVFDVDSKTFRSSQERGLVASRAVAPNDVALAVWTEIARTGLFDPSRLLDRSIFSAAQIASALQRLSDHGEIFLSENVGAKMLVWRELRDRAGEIVDAAHKAHPELRGLELNDLRAALNSLPNEVFDALIADLCRLEFVRVGSTISKRAHRAALPPELKPAADEIRDALAAKPFDPPDRKVVTKDHHLQQALRFLIEQGEIVEINAEIILLRESVDQMQAAASDFISKNGPSTASQLRQKIGTSRRVIIPFLEYLDRTGVTQRIGDLRKLRETKSSAVARS